MPLHYHHRPRKYHSRRRYHHSSHGRKVRLNDGILAVQQLGNKHQPIPERLFNVLPFGSSPYQVGFTAITGVTTFKIFCANNPYDPDPAISGASAAYFAENGLNYQNYICWGSRIRVYASQSAGAIGAPVAVVGVTPVTAGTVSGNTQIPANFDALMTAPQSKWKPVDTYDKPIRCIEHEVKIRDFAGQDPRGDEGWSGRASGLFKNPSGSITGGTSPTKQIFWAIGIYPQDRSADNEATIYVEIDHFVEFQSPVIPYYYQHTLATQTLTVDASGKIEDPSDSEDEDEGGQDDPDDPFASKPPTELSTPGGPPEEISKSEISDSTILTALKKLVK